MCDGTHAIIYTNISQLNVEEQLRALSITYLRYTFRWMENTAANLKFVHI